MKRRISLLALVVLIIGLVATPLLACTQAEQSTTSTTTTTKLSTTTVTTTAVSSPTPTSGAKPATIKIGAPWALSGVLSGTTIPAFNGLQDYIRYVNEQQGGIDGIKVELLWSDTGFQVSRTITAYKRFQGQGVLAIALMSSPDGEALKATLATDKVVAFNLGVSDAMVFPPGWIYLNDPTWGWQFGGFLDWAKANWKGPGTLKVGIIAADTAFGKAIIEPGKAYAAKIGVDLSPIEIVPMTPVDTTAQLLKMKEAGVNWVFVEGIDNTMMPVVND